MPRIAKPGRTVLTLVALVLALLVPISAASPASSQTSPGEAVAAATITLPASELTWQASNRESSADDGAPVELRPGFVYALEDPLLLFDEGDDLQRVPMYEAATIPEPARVLPVAAIAETPVPYLTIELMEAQAIDDPAAVTFPVDAGDYELSLWLIDFANEVPVEAAEHLTTFQMPILMLVRIGEAYIPSLIAGEQPRHLVEGDWAVIEPGQQVAMPPGGAPPVLLFAFLNPANTDAQQPAAPSTGGQAPPDAQAPSRPAETATTAPTAMPTTEPTTSATIAPTEQPTEPPTEVPPTTAPTEPNGSTGGSGSAPLDPVVIVDLPGTTIGPTAPAQNPASVERVELSCVAFVTDTDNDGLSDECERERGSDPNKADSDGDGLADGDEVGKHASDPTKIDTDGDGMTDGDEVSRKTSPTNGDTDGDSLNDFNEVHTYRTDPLRPDTDGDGLDDGFDVGGGTDPLDNDFDDDGLLDGDEVNVYGTSPKEADTDGDGLTDGQEVLTHGTDPFTADADGDCMYDSLEISMGTNPTVADTDGDGAPDNKDEAPLDAGDDSEYQFARCS